jgi:putative phosphoesterase
LKIALLADPHGNLVALQAVLAAAEKHHPEMYLLAGDLVGYGPKPNEVVELADKIRATAVRGNHDQSVIDHDYSWMNQYAAEAARWTAGAISPRNLNRLTSLSDSEILDVDGKKIGLYHGSIESMYDYVTDVGRAELMLRQSDCDIVVCGHTHVPMRARAGDKIYINPGSVGQPRDGNPKASFVILETESLSVELIRVGYDIEATQREMMAAGLPRFLADRLSEGR